MTDREKIRAEVERQYEILKGEYSKTKGAYVAGKMDALDYIEQFIDSLPEETNPIPSPEEAMTILDGKIALRKKNGSWEGTDAENCARYIEEDSK